MLVDLKNIKNASENLNAIISNTPLELNDSFSNIYSSNVYLKREDLQITRSFKLRGAYNKISTLKQNEVKNGIVCSSAGNHAQGVSYSCKKLNIVGTIFMPTTTPQIKIKKVKEFGGDYINVKLVGDSYDDCYKSALDYCTRCTRCYGCCM